MRLDLMPAMISGSSRDFAILLNKPWASFIHLQRPIIYKYTVYSRNCSPRLFGIGHLDEGKTARLARITILHDCDALDRAMGLEESPQLCFRRFQGKIPNENVGHGLNFLDSLRNTQRRKQEEANPRGFRFLKVES